MPTLFEEPSTATMQDPPVSSLSKHTDTASPSPEADDMKKFYDGLGDISYHTHHLDSVVEADLPYTQQADAYAPFILPDKHGEDINTALFHDRVVEKDLRYLPTTKINKKRTNARPVNRPSKPVNSANPARGKPAAPAKAGPTDVGWGDLTLDFSQEKSGNMLEWLGAADNLDPGLKSSVYTTNALNGTYYTFENMATAETWGAMGSM